MNQSFADVCVALSTSNGPGTLAIVRASGSSTFKLISKFSNLASGKSFDEIPGGRVVLGKIFDQEELVDVVTFLIFKAPKSFTGEDVVEIICHNNKIIIQKIINLFLKHGARLARPGEFSQRAFLNQKLDISQAEAIHEIIAAQNEECLKRSMCQLEGSLSHFFEDLSLKIIHLISYIEAYFEFMEEESLDLNLDEKIKEELVEFSKRLSELKNSAELNDKIRSGLKICLVGEPNAGKSTIFNALVGKERSIVSDEAGTTRDTVELSLTKNNLLLTFVDTAGIRRNAGLIESEGIKRSVEEIENSDLILLIADSSKPLIQEDLINKILKHKEKTILVLNKSDLGSELEYLKETFPEHTNTSSSHKKSYQELSAMIQNKIEIILKKGSSPFLLTKRQILLTQELDKAFTEIYAAFESKVCFEILAIKLKDMLFIINEFTGKNLQEEVLSQIFSKFCIGK